MLITKFNKVIRNRLLWTIIALTVCVSFVLSFSDLQGCLDKNSSTRRGFATINGRDVAPVEHDNAVMFELGFRGNRPETEQEREDLDRRAWKRLAALEAAEKLGIVTTDEELSKMIAEDPAFKSNGTFDGARYRSLIESQLRIPVTTFEESLRQNLTIRKLISVMSAMIWLSPSESHRRVKELTDIVQLSVASVNRKDLAKDVTASPDQTRAYFEGHKDEFLQPEQRRIRYAEFPFENYFPSAVSEIAVSNYFEDNITLYTRMTTNGTAETIPLSQVRTSIVQRLRLELAEDGARSNATDLVVSLSADRFGRQTKIDEAVAKLGLTLKDSPFFSLNTPLSAINLDPEVAREAFALDPQDSEGSFSDAILGSNAAYVVVLAETKPARMPEYDEVAALVAPAALSNAQLKAFQERAQALRSTLLSAVQSNMTFAAAAQSLGLKVSTTPPTSLYENMASNRYPHAKQLLTRASTLTTGQVTEAIFVDDLAFVASVASRSSASNLLVSALTPRLANTIEEFRSGVLYDTWADYLLRPEVFTDLRPKQSDNAE